jgi:hypothetical protein
MNIETSIETSIESSALMSIRMQIGHPNETCAESTIATTRAETPIDIVTITPTHPLDAMMDFLRRLGITIVRVAGMVESISGWCFSTVIGPGARRAVVSGRRSVLTVGHRPLTQMARQGFDSAGVHVASEW